MTWNVVRCPFGAMVRTCVSASVAGKPMRRPTISAITARTGTCTRWNSS